MEDGAMRCDVNVSLRPAGTEPFGIKVEVKNLNSARSVQRALEYEIERQARALKAGERVMQETRGWDDDRGITVSQRSKEEAHDYRYFPEPDLPPVFVSEALLEKVRASLPELPRARVQRLQQQHGLSAADARTLCGDRALADFFEAGVPGVKDAKKLAN